MQFLYTRFIICSTCYLHVGSDFTCTVCSLESAWYTLPWECSDGRLSSCDRKMKIFCWLFGHRVQYLGWAWCSHGPLFGTGGKPLVEWRKHWGGRVLPLGSDMLHLSSAYHTHEVSPLLCCDIHPTPNTGLWVQSVFPFLVCPVMPSGLMMPVGWGGSGWVMTEAGGALLCWLEPLHSSAWTGGIVLLICGRRH